MIAASTGAARPRADGRARRILIVDDSVVARAVIARMIDQGSVYHVAAAVSDIRAALAFLAREQVDIILLDIEMPGLDGLTALPDVIAAGRGAKVLIVSSACEEGAGATVRALSLGAADTLVKPAHGGMIGAFTATLEDKLGRLMSVDRAGARAPSPVSAPGDFDIVAIGASTGGIHALSALLRALPTAFRTPILITQHLPGSFMPYFAAQVAVLAGRPCEVAADHVRIRSGRVFVAPGDAHLRCVRLADGSVALRLTMAAAKSGCMPSVDPMLASVSEVYGTRALAIILSGMGRDGADGAHSVYRAGGCVVAQDEASSVVWGMPGAIVRSGMAAAILPPEEIGRMIAAGCRPV